MRLAAYWLNAAANTSYLCFCATISRDGDVENDRPERAFNYLRGHFVHRFRRALTALRSALMRRQLEPLPVKGKGIKVWRVR